MSLLFLLDVNGQARYRSSNSANTLYKVKQINGIRFYFTLILPDLDYIVIGFISIYLCNQCLKPVRCDVHSCRGDPLAALCDNGINDMVTAVKSSIQ